MANFFYYKFSKKSKNHVYFYLKMTKFVCVSMYLIYTKNNAEKD